MKVSDGKGAMFDHMNTKNLSAQELEAQRKRKKRNFTEMSTTAENDSGSANTVNEFKKPEPVQKSVKECPFNPFGDDSCDMCGS